MAAARVAAATGDLNMFGVEGGLLHRRQPLGQVAGGQRLTRRQPLAVGEVFNQRRFDLGGAAAIFVGDHQAVHQLHTADGHLPAFRGFALLADTAEAGVTGGVAAQTVAVEQLLVGQRR